MKRFRPYSMYQLSYFFELYPSFSKFKAIPSIIHIRRLHPHTSNTHTRKRPKSASQTGTAPYKNNPPCAAILRTLSISIYAKTAEPTLSSPSPKSWLSNSLASSPFNLPRSAPTLSSRRRLGNPRATNGASTHAPKIRALDLRKSSWQISIFIPLFRKLPGD